MSRNRLGGGNSDQGAKRGSKEDDRPELERQRQDLCPPGSFVYVPPNVRHTFKVVSGEPGAKLNIFSPAAMVGFFEELAEAEANGTATPEALSHIAERHDMAIVGPVPDAYL